MPERQAPRPYDSVALKWRDLADRKRQHFAEMYRSGRWKLYYDQEEEFLARLREVVEAADAWHRIAPDQDRQAAE